MSRDLLGLTLLAIICIMIAPFYKRSINIHHSKQLSPVIHSIEKDEIVSRKSSNPKTLVFLSDSFLPTTFAGSELSGYETIQYLRSRGHNIIIFVKTWKVSEYNGFPIYKYDINNPFCKSALETSDIILFQMGDETKNFQIIQHRKKPVYIFIHMANSYPWLLQQKIGFPVFIVYNSHMTQDLIPSLHDNMRMIPYVDTKRFTPLRTLTTQKDVVCLINCNKNKGGEIFRKIAYKMSNVQFLGVKGGYSDQVVDKSPPPNLRYIDNQTDIRVVFRQIGILVMPSKNETWGRTAVEAMASGVPVIHSEATGLVECVGGAGILCLRDDEDEWINAIRRIIGDRAYRERLRQNGFNRIKEIEREQERGREELAMKIESI